jgi:hypothetical protein
MRKRMKREIKEKNALAKEEQARNARIHDSIERLQKEIADSELLQLKEVDEGDCG